MSSLQDLVAAWLAQVHRDSELAAPALRAAFALSRRVNTDGCIICSGLENLDDLPDGNMDQLIARKHVVRVKRGYRIVLIGVSARPLMGGSAKTASVVPFPAARRRGLISRLVTRMMVRDSTQAETYLRDQLRVQAEAMRRRGIADHVIASETHALKSAVRAALWRAVIQRKPDGAA